MFRMSTTSLWLLKMVLNQTVPSTTLPALLTRARLRYRSASQTRTTMPPTSEIRGMHATHLRFLVHEISYCLVWTKFVPDLFYMARWMHLSSLGKILCLKKVRGAQNVKNIGETRQQQKLGTNYYVRLLKKNWPYLVVGCPSWIFLLLYNIISIIREKQIFSSSKNIFHIECIFNSFLFIDNFLR